MFKFSEKFFNSIDYLTDTALKKHGNGAEVYVNLVRNEIREAMSALVELKGKQKGKKSKA